MDKKENTIRSLVHSRTVWQPPFPLIVIEAFNEDDGVESRVLPVLGVETSKISEYRIRGQRYEEYRTHNEYIRAGWLHYIACNWPEAEHASRVADAQREVECELAEILSRVMAARHQGVEGER